MSTYGVVPPTLLGVGAGRPSELTASLTVTSSASGCAAEAARLISAARVWLRSSDRMDRMLDEVCDVRRAFVNKRSPVCHRTLRLLCHTPAPASTDAASVRRVE